MRVVLTLVTLIVFHSVDGTEVAINPEQITSLRQPKPNPGEKMFVEGASCLIGLTDGKFVVVAEGCEAVEKVIGVVK